MPRQFDVITFDCYGTLVDWEAGISGAFLSAAAVSGTSLDPAAVLRSYARHEPEVESEGFRHYREVLVQASRRVAAELGWTIPPGGETFLPESLPAWPPFPDTNEALLRLSVAGYRLGILSNVDDDLLASTCRHFSVPFDFAITAQQVRSYKPAYAHFHAARNRIGSGRWLHAAQSFFHDVIPAAEQGIPIAWINRKREGVLAGDIAPTVELENLLRLVDWLDQ
ncbi:MAG: HAD-IA family hydrolase [Acidobacteria bacterium]|nr:HAD-IA family hydrolase [Acidobacteriota bacterium]